jgi:hypothetical protein
VHRPLGQQRQNGCSHVTAPSAAGTAAAPPAASPASEAGAETGAETRAEATAETGAETEWSLVSACLVVTEVFDEFLSGMPPGAVHCTSLRGTGAEAEAEARPAGERSAGRSELVVHVCSPYVC